MSRSTITRIETADTGKVYEFPPGKEKNPQLWEAKISVACVHENSGSPYGTGSKTRVVYLERDTLIECGLLGMKQKKEDPAPPEKTAEDLILELLHHVGVFPEH